MRSKLQLARLLILAPPIASSAAILPTCAAAQVTKDVIELAKTQDWASLRTLVDQGVDVTMVDLSRETALHWASLHAHAESVNLLLAAGADVNASNELGATPIWAASLSGSLEAAKMLLDAGADPNATLRGGETPLMSAVRSGDPATVEALLEHGADPNLRGPRGQTALMWAAAARYPRIVATLIEQGADVHARSDEWEQLKAHEPHVHPEHQVWVTQGGNSALMFAARSNDLESIRHLVASGAAVDDADGWGISALTMAAYSSFGVLVVEPFFAAGGPIHLGGHERLGMDQGAAIIEFLIKQGADPDLGADKFTALHASIMRRDEGSVRLLLENGADPNTPLGTLTPTIRSSNSAFFFHRAWVGATPFWLAARFGTPAMLRSLIDHGADPLILHRGVHYSGAGVLGGGIFSDRQEEVTTALMAAVGMSKTGRAWVYPWSQSPEHEDEVLQKVRILLELGVDPHVYDEEGRTAVQHAEEAGYQSVADLLLSQGAGRGEPE